MGSVHMSSLLGPRRQGVVSLERVDGTLIPKDVPEPIHYYQPPPLNLLCKSVFASCASQGRETRPRPAFSGGIQGSVSRPSPNSHEYKPYFEFL